MVDDAFNCILQEAWQLSRPTAAAATIRVFGDASAMLALKLNLVLLLYRTDTKASRPILTSLHSTMARTTPLPPLCCTI